MKATGIVRRIDSCGILGQKPESLDMTGSPADFVQIEKRKIGAEPAPAT